MEILTLHHQNFNLIIIPAGKALLNAYFGQGGGQIVLDDVQCTGSENKLLACISAPILRVSSNCDDSNDAGVRCEGISCMYIVHSGSIQDDDCALCY